MITFEVDGSEHMRVQENGRLFLGTTSNTFTGAGNARVQVSGSGADTSGINLIRTGSSGGGAGNGASTGGAGTANTGGGGGGGGTRGGNGGSGIVIISYAGSQKYTGGTVTSSGGNTIHSFTSSGTLAPS